ncbi:hypothetical protein HDV04_005944 [Boothiomyces sp. JEL0838]|nr:hypothetical protein HDV04_005944 [Boothiomyces sp. JEL0838]
MSQIVFQTAWLSSFCTGPPDTMIIFNETTPTLAYAVFGQVNPIPYCGLSMADIDIGCCLASLDLGSSFNYSSVSRNYLTDYSLAQSIPKAAVGKTYCTLLSNDPFSLFGYQEMYFLPSAMCLENQFKCYSDRLEIYAGNDCTGFTETVTLHQEATVFNSSIIGNVTIGFLSISNGTWLVEWTGYIQGNLLVPNFSEPIEIISLLLEMITGILILVLLASVSKKYLKTKRNADLWSLMSISFLIVALAFQVCYQYLVIDSIYLLNVLTFIEQIVTIWSLFFCITNCNLLYAIFKVYSLLIIYGGYILCILAYFGFMGLVYGCLISILFLSGSCSNYYNTVLDLQIGWNLVYMIFGMIPPTIIIVTVLTIQIRKIQGSSLIYKNRKIILFAVLELLCAIISCMVGYLKQQLSRNDRQLLAIEYITGTLEPLNFYCLMMVMEQVTAITKTLVKPNKAIPKPAQSATVKSEKIETVQQDTVKL